MLQDSTGDTAQEPLTLNVRMLSGHKQVQDEPTYSNIEIEFESTIHLARVENKRKHQEDIIHKELL
eukprot:4772399-Amphidinium_carterae.1